MSDYDQKCGKCGAPASNHPYRHPFVGHVSTLADAAARIKELEARLEAMTQQHAAALEAVGKAREAAMREAAEICTGIVKDYDVMKPDGKTYEPIRVQKAAKGMVRLARQDILAIINKGDSNGLV